MSDAEHIASELLRIKAVKLQPNDLFTWASGIKSPIYTDNRVALAYPEVRDAIRDGLAALVEEFAGAEAVVGVATAGIPHAALVANKLMLPMAYVRSSAKKHGRQNRIEGRLQPGQKVVVVEDLISTGGSALDAVAALRDVDVEVLGTLAIFTYGFAKAETSFAEANCQLKTLTDYPTLIRVATNNGTVNSDDVSILQEWRSRVGAQ